MHLRGLLTRTVGLAVAAALVVSGVADILMLRVALHHDLSVTLRREARVVARLWLRRGILPQARRLPVGVSAAVYGPNGLLVTWMGRTPPARPARIGSSVAGHELQFALALPHGQGEVLTFESMAEPLERPVQRLEEILLVVTVLSLILAWLVAARLARDLAYPLSHLAGLAGKISRTADLEAQVSVDSRVAEVRELAVSFNAMVGRLRTLFEALRASEQRERALREATAHDLRTPLTTVMATLELLENDALSPSDREEALHLARQEAKHLAERLELALQAKPSEATDIAEVASRLAVGRAWVHLPEQPLTVLAAADAQEVVEVLDLLIDNALRHNPEGTEVWLDWWPHEGDVFVTVRDNGQGIPPDLLPHAFERNAVSETSTGLGLGLGLARDLVRSRGGDIQIERVSAAGGTRVTVRWPLAKAPTLLREPTRP